MLDENSRQGSETGSAVLPDPPEPKVLVVDESKLRAVLECGVERTENWTLLSLERLGAALMQIFEKYSNKWDRTGLAEEFSDFILSSQE